MNILIIYGPNFNLIGVKSASLNKKITLNKINKKIKNRIKNKKINLKILQSNVVGKTINFLHKNRNWSEAVLIAPSSWSINQYDLFETLQIFNKPLVDLYLNEKYDTNKFYKNSIFTKLSLKTFIGSPEEIFINGIEEILNLKNDSN